ncbi:MAG: thioredoxin family protein [Bacteroidales bacterium]|nr:thioredoxin family protein [Bacteroidales bacterium]
MDIQELQYKIEHSDALMVYFFSDHCAPCISLRPKIQALLRDDFLSIELLFIDSEALPELSAYYQVFSLPTFILYFQGKEFQRWSKYVSIGQLSQAIARPYQLLFSE